MERSRNVDIMKGIGIFLVVLGHSYFWGDRFITLFHMPLFFMLSGYCYNEKYSADISSLILLAKKRLKSLYLPYMLSNLVFACFHNVFVKYQIYTNNPLFLEQTIGNHNWGLIDYYSTKEFIYNILLIIGFVGGEQLEGSVWFLRIMFELTIAYACTDYVARKMGKGRMWFNGGIAVLLLIFGYYFSIKGIRIVAGLDIACSCMIFFTLGIVLKKISIWKKLPPWSVLLVCFVGLIINTGHGYVSMAANDYSSPLFMVYNAILGWGFAWAISEIIIKFCKRDLFEYMGKKSMYILLLHFLCFKLVTYVYIHSNNLPGYLLASFPTLKISYLWIAYVLVGIFVPLGISLLIDCGKALAKKRVGAA